MVSPYRGGDFHRHHSRVSRRNLRKCPSGGAIVWFILLPMSVLTGCLIIEHLVTIRRKKLLPDGTVKDILSTIQKFGLNQFSARAAAKQDLITVAMNYAIGQKGFEKGRDHIRNLIGESLQEQSLRLFRKVEWLNIIGNVSPMIGLFGTVVGMIEAFNQIVVAGGQPQPAQLADGISVALVTTYWGLLIAIPALTVQGMLRNRVEAVASEAAMEAETLVSEIAKISIGSAKAAAFIETKTAGKNPAESIKERAENAA